MSTPPDPRYRITVVCLGNICRSPIGESVLRERIEQAGLADLVVVDSAGTGDWHVGHDADPRARQALADHGYRLAHAARQIDASWFEGIDLVLAMDAANYADLTTLAGTSASAVDLRMMRSFDPELAHLNEPHAQLDVPDPYHGADEDFVEVLRMLERAADGLLAEMPARLNR